MRVVRFAKPLAAFLIAGLIVLLGGIPSAFAQGHNCFTDHGIAARVSEKRGVNATRTSDGQPLILAVESSGPGSSLLVINAESGATTQHYYPSKAKAKGGIFTRLLASSGKYYLMFRGTFVEFDPAKREWTFAEEVKPNSLAMSFAEAPDGVIYFATYPRSELYRYDPEAQEVERLTQLDPDEKYPYYLAVGNEGWIYAGMGTTHGTLVAYHPETGNKKLIYETTLRVGKGTAMGAIPNVHRGADGEVYGEAWPGGPWLRLHDGKADWIEGKEPARPTRYRSAKFTKELTQLPNGGEIRDFDLAARTFELARADGTTKHVTFDYESGGAGITSLVIGPGSNVYGSTSHPFRLFRYTPGTKKLTDLGGLDRIGGGNFTDFAVADGIIYGAAYLGGHLYAYDPEQPWSPEAEPVNPRHLKSYSTHITRPRVAQAQPERHRVIVGGFPGYGRVGGGLAFYNYETGESTLLTGDQLLEGQSTVTVRVLPDGDLVGGTSVRAPGGAHEIAEEGALYLMDGATKEITYSTHPVEGAKDIASVALGGLEKSQVYGISGEGQLFAFDPKTQKVTGRRDLSTYGRAVGVNEALRRGPEGAVYVLMTKGVLRVDPGPSLAIKEAALPPVRPSAGMGVSDGRLYFGADTKMWSYELGCGGQP